MDANGDLARQRCYLGVWTAGLLGFLMLQMAALAWMLMGPGLLFATTLGALLWFWLTPSNAPTSLLQAQRAWRLYPEDAPPLASLATDLAGRGKLVYIPRLYLVPNPWLNAFTLELPQGPSIVVSVGLLRHLSLYELTGVLAHEMSHIRGGDIQMVGLATSCRRITRWLAVLGVAVLLLDQPAVLAVDRGWAALLVLAAPLLADLAQLALFRVREFHADLDAADLLADPRPLIAALSRMAEHEEYSPLPRSLTSRHHASLLRTHPATRQRIERLRRLRMPAPQRVLAPGVHRL